VGVSYYSLLSHTCSNNTRPEDLPSVLDGFDPNTKLYDSGRFKLGKVAGECEVEEESSGDDLDNYLAEKDDEVTDFEGFSD
jgi:hypothetical protein